MPTEDLEKYEREARLRIALIHARAPLWAIGFGVSLLLVGVLIPNLSNRKADLLADTSKLLIAGGLTGIGVLGVGALGSRRGGPAIHTEEIDHVTISQTGTDRTPLNLPQYPEDPEPIKYRRPLEPRQQNSFKGYPGE
jgi:hypothetical protein